MEQNSSLRVFRKNEEALVLLLPLILLVPVALQIIFGWKFAVEGLYGKAVGEILGMNALHTSITWIMLLFVPEFLSWSKDVNKDQKMSFRNKSLLVAGVILAFFALSLFHKKSPLFDLYIIFLALLPNHHTVSQVRGISFCYGSAYLNEVPSDDKISEKIHATHKQEKILTTVLIGGMVLHQLTQYFFAEKYWSGPIMILLKASIVAALVLLVFVFLRLPKPLAFKKIAFNFRLVFYILSFFSSIAIIAIQVFHGLEYFFLFRKMSDVSTITKKRRYSMFYVFFGVSMLLTISLYPKFLFGWALSAPLAPILFRSLSVLRGTHTFTHYFLDARIYAMKTPASRKWIAPLLNKNS